MSESAQPFHLEVAEVELQELRRRLSQTRWPEKEPVADWSQGVPLASLQALCEYWRTRYDWRRCERLLNGFGQYRIRIQGLGIHFLHIRSREPNAMPLIMTHGWPGSVIEFHKVVKPLTDPVAHGGHAADAFHLVIPSLPGFGFSDKPNATGWGIERIADAWADFSYPGVFAFSVLAGAVCRSIDATFLVHGKTVVSVAVLGAAFIGVFTLLITALNTAFTSGGLVLAPVLAGLLVTAIRYFDNPNRSLCSLRAAQNE